MKKLWYIFLQALSMLGIPFLAWMIVFRIATSLGIENELTYLYIYRLGIYPTSIFWSVILAVTLSSNGGAKWVVYTGCGIGALLMGTEFVLNWLYKESFPLWFGALLCGFAYVAGMMMQKHSEEINKTY